MKRVEEKTTHVLNVTPEQAWKLIGAVDGVDRWFGSMIKSCRVEGDKRYCLTTDDKPLHEQILEVNHETKTFRFAIPEQDLLPTQNIEETMQVRDENGKASVEWKASFDIEDEHEESVKEAFRTLWKTGLQEMETYIRTQQEVV